MTNSLTRSKIHDSFDLSKICKKRFLRFDFQKLEEDPSIYRRITKKLQKTNSLTRLESQRSTTIDYSSIYRRFAIDKFFARYFRFLEEKSKIHDSFSPSKIYKKTIPSDPSIYRREIDSIPSIPLFPHPSRFHSRSSRVNPTMIKQIDNVRTLIKTGRLSDIFDYPRI